MITVHNTRTVTNNIVSVCVYKGRRSLGTKMIIVASDNRNVNEWIYRYLEPYEARGCAFYQVENEGSFSEYAGKADTVMAFVEDIFFGERTLGRLDYIRKQYSELRLVLLSVSRLLGYSGSVFVLELGQLSVIERLLRGNQGSCFRKTAGASIIFERQC